MDHPALRLARVPFGDPEVQALVEQVQAEYVARYGGPDVGPMDEAMFAAPRGAFFLGRPAGSDDSRPPEAVAMGGWRMRDDVHPWRCAQAAEIKRMYVVPAARRRGYARAVLAHLELTARDAGADVMVLETGVEQPEALTMYAAAGYVAVERFGYYADSPLSRYLGRRLG